MSFEGTRTKRGSEEMDWAAIGRGIALQIGLVAVLAPVTLTVPFVRIGYVMLLGNVAGGVYVGFRTGNYGDEYMDGGAVGVLGAIVMGILAGTTLVFLMGPVTGQEPRSAALVGIFLVNGVGAAIALIPIGGVACAASAWFVARHFRE